MVVVLRSDINSDTDIMRFTAGVPAVPLWQPTNLGSKLVGWFKADSLVNGVVTGPWTDSISGGTISSAGVAQPTKAAASFNSAYGGVTFTTDDYLLGTVPGTWPIDTASVELWAVVDQKSLVADTTIRTFFSYGGGTNANSLMLQRRVTTAVNRMQVTIAGINLPGTGVDFSGPHIVAGVGYGTTQEIWVDGALTNTGAGTIGSLATRTVVGGNNAGVPSTFAEVCIRHLFVIAGTLTSGEKARLFGWCAWDCNLTSILPANHPYKLAAPTTAWNPWDLDTKLKFWVTPDDVGTDDGGGLISSITDRAGGMVLTATTTARPTRGLTSFNSAYPGWTFDGVANCFVSTSLGTIPTGATAGSIFMVLSNLELSASLLAIRYGGGGANIDRGFQRVTSTFSRLRIFDGSAQITDVSGVVFDGLHIIMGSWSGTTQSGRIDGADTNPASGVIPTLTTGTTRLRIGASNLVSAGSFWKGVIRHTIITTALTLLEQQKLEGWGAWGSGLQSLLPVGHPYKSAAP